MVPEGDRDRPDHVYSRDGDLWVPSPIAAGPWDPGAQHGGPPAALFGRLIRDHEPGDTRWFLARLTVELVRPVPLTPLVVELEVVRPGARVQLIDARMTAAGTEVARARGLRLAETGAGPDETEVPAPPPLDVPKPSSVPRWHLKFDRISWPTFGEAIDLRPVKGQPFVELGAAAVWFRLEVPLLAGEPIDPLDRVLTAADFPNGISNVVPIHRFVYINPDLSVHLHRLPAGEWVLLDAQSWLRRAGYGQSRAGIHDEEGALGTALQSLLVWER
jgi:hypothetical protein